MPSAKHAGAGRVAFAPLPGAEAEHLDPFLVRVVDWVRGKGEAAGAAFIWTLTSISMTLLNKQAVAKTHAPVAVVVVQMVSTAVIALAVGLATKNVATQRLEPSTPRPYHTTR